MKKYVAPSSDKESHVNSARETDCLFSPDVEFCAYAIPHPSEPKMNIRIQTYGASLLEDNISVYWRASC